MTTATTTWLRLACLLALLAAIVTPTAAHDIPNDLRVHAWMRAEGERLQVLVRVPLALLLNLDLPKRGNGYLDLPHVQDQLPRAIEATTKDFAVFEDGERLTPLASEARISMPSDKSFQTYEQALASIRGSRLPDSTDVFWNQGYFDAAIEYRIRSAGAGFAIDFNVSPGLRDKLKLDLRYVTADGTIRAFEPPTAAGRIMLDPRWYQAGLSFVKSGFDHILGGLDHLLFLICLVAPFRRFSGYLVGVISAFTVAHSVTLIAAAYGLVPTGNWFSPLVEVLIALSILYMAVENVLRPNLRWRWLVAGAFGLVHGFGFSFALANELQFAGSHLLLSLLAFNVGIEVGQLLVLMLALPALMLLLNRRPTEERIVVAVISAFVAHSAWHWMMERWAALLNVDWPTIGEPFIAGTLVLILLGLAALLFLKGLARGEEARHRAPMTSDKGSANPGP